MDKIISIKNLSFFYNKRQVFNKLNMDISKGKWTTIIGNNGSGKTTLISLILGKLKYDGQIEVNAKTVETIRDEFNYKNLNEQLDKLLKTLKTDEQKIKKEQFINKLGLKKLFCLDYNLLNENEQKIIRLISTIINEPDLLILDNLLEDIEYQYKEKIIKILKICMQRGMTIVNFTQNTETSLLGDDVIILGDGKVILSETKEEIFNNTKIFKDLKLNLPFIIDLAIKLKYYGLVDKLYFDDGDLVDAIWK